MSNNISLSNQIKELSDIEKSQRLNVMNVLTVNDGHLKTSLYGLTKNFDLLTDTLVSWVIAAVFLAFGAGSFFMFGSLGVVVYLAFVEAMFIWLGLNSIKEFKNVMNSIENIKYAIDKELIDHQTVVVNDGDDAVNVSYMTSKDKSVSESFGLIARFVAIFNSKQLLGAVILKHKNHTPFIIIMAVVCLILIAMTHKLAVIVSSIALLITLISCFTIKGKIYKIVVVYFSGIKQNLMEGLKERVDEINKETVHNASTGNSVDE